MSATTACVYAALMLQDAGKTVDAASITTAVEASGVEVSATLPILFERFLAKNSVSDLIAKAASSGAAPSAAAAAPAAGGAAPAAAAKKAPEPESDGDDEMNSLF
eukprot:254036_1